MNLGVRLQSMSYFTRLQLPDYHTTLSHVKMFLHNTKLERYIAMQIDRSNLKDLNHSLNHLTQERDGFILSNLLLITNFVNVLKYLIHTCPRNISITKNILKYFSLTISEFGVPRGDAILFSRLWPENSYQMYSCSLRCYGQRRYR